MVSGFILINNIMLLEKCLENGEKEVNLNFLQPVINFINNAKQKKKPRKYASFLLLVSFLISFFELRILPISLSFFYI